MTKYLLPCDCGESIPIDATQAGQPVSCSCGRTMEIPTMRALRQLEPCAAAEQPKRKAEWNASAGAVFAIGTLVTICGLAVGGFGYFNWWHNQLPPLPQIYIDSYVLEVDEASADQVWDMWNQTLEMRLAPYESAPEVVARRTAEFFLPVVYVGLAIAAVGIAVAMSALLFKRRV